MRATEHALVSLFLMSAKILTKTAERETPICIHTFHVLFPVKIDSKKVIK